MDQRLKIKSYTPDTSTYSPRISNEQWDQYKSLLKHLHGEGYKRAAMLEIIRQRGFNPSMGQLNAKMTAWGFKVYGTQSEPQDQDRDSETASQMQSFDSSDTAMAEAMENDLTLSPTSRRSLSSITLCETERTIKTQHNDQNSSLDEVISQQVLALNGTYWPATSPADFGIKWSENVFGGDRASHHYILSTAEFLCAVHCFEQAFDLYQIILEHFVVNSLDKHISLVRCLVQCAISATSDAQCSYISTIVQCARSYCFEHGMVELSSCFSALLNDLCTPETKGRDSFDSLGDRASDMALLIATDSQSKSMAYNREWLLHLLSNCDGVHSTLSHLSVWCQDTLSFYKLENQVIVRNPPKTASDGMQEMTSFEHDFQVLASALVIDYLNSPGPSMKKANVECKDDDCVFRSDLSPSTSLIIMAHLLYEPLRLQTQDTSNNYLRSRAQQFATVQSMTALQELKSFESVDSSVRCSAFVDTFMKHSSTTLAFRRFAASMNINSIWDRITAAKRLTLLLQNNQTGTLPHAGLPCARRNILKTMAAPFSLDESLSESRRSMASDGGSMGEFERLAHQIGGPSGLPGTLTPSDAMSIDTRSSWSFHRVTGFSAEGLSHSNSMSSRGRLSHTNSVASRQGRGVDQDEMEEYRDFIKQNNYSQQSLVSNTDSSTQRFPTPTVKDFPS